MVNLEHVALLERGAAAIQEWKRQNPGKLLTLRGLILTPFRSPESEPI